MSETCAASVVDAAEAFVSQIPRHAVSLLGWSLGGVVAYEIARRIEWRGDIVERLVVASAPVPHLARAIPLPPFTISDAELVGYLRKMGGTPPELLDHPSMPSFFLPILRADLALAHGYRHEAGPRLKCPLFALVGSEDTDFPEGRSRAWGELTEGSFRLEIFFGGHFFGETASERLFALLRDVVGEA
jgi:surfactin synthase thioesterase subunit